jgi:transcription antitermination factor NusG
MNGATTIELDPSVRGAALVPDHAPRSSSAWHALWTRSHCEQLVYDQLAAKGFDLLLPKIEQWSRRGGLRHLIRVPMFSGYVFLHAAMNKASYVEIVKARGLVQVLGERWDRLTTIPDREIDAIRRIVDARVPALPYPYLREGQRVRITRGPLTDVEGILVRTKPNRGLLVVSVDLLRRSVAAHVDCTWVVPA